MTEEVKTQEQPKNTVATVGMWFSIIGLIALITVFFAWLWFPMLFVWFILWIVGLFYKPRGKARVAVIIPLVVFIALASIACYVWKSVKTPANEFVEWAKPQLEQLESEDFDEDRFERLLNVEVNKITNDKTEDDWKAMFDASTGSNLLEKGSYLFFSVLRQSMETALEKYNNGEIVEIDEEDNHIIDMDVDVNDDEIDQDSDDEDNDESNGDNDEQVKPVEQKEVTASQSKKSNNGTFSQSEQNDIEQVLNILE